ncbi:MAG TPA: dipeptidyl carboxypeptidase II, partial [Terriglobales bacterium]
MRRSVLVAFAIAVLACNIHAMNPSGSDKQMQNLSADNPFAQQSTLPYHLPPFDRIKDADFRPAFEAGMAEQREEITAIDKNQAAPTFENTVVALERSGRLLDRVSAVFFNLNSSNTNPEILKIASEMAPKLAAHHDAIMLDETLFARLDAIYQQRANLKLDPEAAYLLERTHTVFVRAGAKLSAAEKTKLRELNEQIASLTTQFQ